MIKKIENNLREFVYGGMDGAVTTFAVVTGAAGANLGVRVILILGFANVLADGFSMAVGSYLSEKSDQELRSTSLKSKLDRPKALRASLATFISFVLIGTIPLLVYLVDFIADLNADENTLLMYSILLTLIMFGVIGYLRAVVTKSSKKRAILESLGLGIVAALISFSAGTLLEGLIGA